MNYPGTSRTSLTLDSDIQRRRQWCNEGFSRSSSESTETTFTTTSNSSPLREGGNRNQNISNISDKLLKELTLDHEWSVQEVAGSNNSIIGAKRRHTPNDTLPPKIKKYLDQLSALGCQVDFFPAEPRSDGFISFNVIRNSKKMMGPEEVD